MERGLLFQAVVYLAATVVAVPVAKRLGLGSVLGYLVAGVIIGPFGLRLVGDERQDVLHVAEFGVVMMLFLIGLELEPARLWRLRRPILGLGGLQVALTGLALAGVGIGFGFAWQASVAVGLIFALSSTAIVLQTLDEKGLMGTEGGRSAFSVLLFQDIAVIPLIAVLPLLAVQATAVGVDAHGGTHDSWVTGLPGWARALVVVGAVAAVVLLGRFVVQPALRYIARTRLQEVFTAAALLLVTGIALLMNEVGLSPALGAFLAGVVLANSEYRHELEIDLAPFKGLLLGLFFISVGASIDFWVVAADPQRVVLWVAALIAVKFAILLALARVSRMSLDQSLLFSFSLAQSGEFAFVLFTVAVRNGVLSEDRVAPLIAVVALSMALTPLLMLLNEKLVQPRFGTRENAGREADAMDEENRVIIAGFGRFGQIVGRLLGSNGFEATVLDVDSDHVDMLRRMGIRVFYGDASRLDLLRAAGAEKAKLLIVAVDEPDKSLEIIRSARRHFPQLTILTRARGVAHAHDLLTEGIEQFYRETVDSSLRLGADALRLLGFRAYQAQRATRRFRKHDEHAVRELCLKRHDRTAYVDLAREKIEDMERVMRADLEDVEEERDAAWDTATLIQEAGEDTDGDDPPQSSFRPSGSAT